MEKPAVTIGALADLGSRASRVEPQPAAGDSDGAR